jgi:hypothetical protein
MTKAWRWYWGIVGSLFAVCIAIRVTFEVTARRATGASFVVLPAGRVAAQVWLALENATDAPRHYVVSLADAPDAELTSSRAVWEIAAHRAQEIPLVVAAARATFTRGERRVHLRIFDDEGFGRIVAVTLRGPADGGAP